MKEITINKVTLKGFVKSEPKIRYFSDSNVKAYFPLVTFDIYRNQNEEKRIPEFHNIVAWKEIAQAVEESIKEGQLIELTGRLKVNRYEKDGEEKLAVHIVLAEFKILNQANKKNEKSYPPTTEQNKLSPMDDDLFESNDQDVLPF